MTRSGRKIRATRVWLFSGRVVPSEPPTAASPSPTHADEAGAGEDPVTMLIGQAGRYRRGRAGLHEQVRLPPCSPPHDDHVGGEARTS